MVGSLGYEYSGIQSTNLVLALFALVAIESGSQRLGRSYAGFLGLMLVLDTIWLAVLGPELW
jgi:drug/metabolite transporter superfamily protein YnfA